MEGSIVTKYSFTKVVNIDSLSLEIRLSDIVTALSHIDQEGSNFDVWFKAALSTGDETILTELVSDHVNTPLEETVVPRDSENREIVKLSAFSEPDFRTKNDASDLVDAPLNDTTSSDYRLLEELYLSGGDIVINNAEHGDWVKACIYDKDAVIPEYLRSGLCEAWPVVVTYVKKMLVKPSLDNKIDTRPLNAKLTPGLYLRISLTTTNTGSLRSFGINYDLQKRLQEGH